MRLGLLLLLLSLPAQAMAVPPLAPAAENSATIKAYQDAVSANDRDAYLKLFSAAAVIELNGVVADEAKWRDTVDWEFSPRRRVRFVQALSSWDRSITVGRFATRVLLIQEVRSCMPGVAECFSQFRSETISVVDGQIARLRRDEDFTHHQVATGRWVFNSYPAEPLEAPKP